MPFPVSKNGYSVAFYVIAILALLIAVFIANKYVPNRKYVEFVGVGSSMEPALFDGDTLWVDPDEIPSERDIIVFSCLSCDPSQSSETMTKRVYDINETGCYWLLGDNRETSHDSRNFGWLCEDDMELHGVVEKIE